MRVSDYTGNYVYKNGVLEHFGHSEGYSEFDGNGKIAYIYQYKDHLGNVRLSYSDKNKDGNIDVLRNDIDVDGDGDDRHELLAEINYYPFGLQHKGYNNTIIGREDHFKFNGTELTEDLGYNMYEMPLRSYDPAIARWNRMDPVIHHGLSPYNAFDNNPVYYADPSGGDSEWGVSGGTHYGGDSFWSGVRSDWLVSFSGGYSYGSNLEGALGSLGFFPDSNSTVSAGEMRDGGSLTDPFEDFFAAAHDAVGAKYGVENGSILSGLGNGAFGGGQSTWEAAKSVFTKEGANKILSRVIQVIDLTLAGTTGLKAWGNEFNRTYGQAAGIAGGLYGFASSLPNKTSYEISYGIGFGLEKIAEGLILTKGAGLAKNALTGSALGRTILGSDAATLANASRMTAEKGAHQLLVHGKYDYFIINGVATTPKEVARSLLSNGLKKGTPIRCISCHTGKFSDGAAYQLSRYLKSPVNAPTDMIRVLDNGGYQIYNNGVWKQF